MHPPHDPPRVVPFFSGDSQEQEKRCCQKKNWDSLPISAIFQNGRRDILEFQYFCYYFM